MVYVRSDEEGKGVEERRDDEGDELNKNLPENCPCYEKWLQEERKKITRSSRNKYFSFILRFKNNNVL